MGRFRGAVLFAAFVLAGAVGLTTAPSAGASGATTVPVREIRLAPSAAYTPKAPPGATDDYHCVLLDPHINKSAYIISSVFLPGSKEDHHAALFLLKPSKAAQAKRQHAFGKGWTCFGAGTLPNAPLSDFTSSALLSNWSPGSGPERFPHGTGFPVPAGSLVIMQVHYNLLTGHKPVKNAMILRTVPISTHIQPLRVQEFEAAPDIPCPADVTGPLCDRAASLANQGVRFGSMAVLEANGIESLCGRSMTDPPAGASTSCTQAMGSGGYIVRVAPHMHLLGVGFSMVANPGTPEARTILTVPHYDFHNQHAYNLAKPIKVTAGEPVQMTCTYDPMLSQELPALRKVAPHYVTWGDGSTDEMCVGVVWTSATPPNAKAPA